MRRVLKWDVPVDDKDHPIGAGEVVLVACQSTVDVVQVWTDEYEDQPRMRSARVYGTGQAIMDFDSHLGSVMTHQGRLVWHVYAAPSIARKGAVPGAGS